MRRLLLLGFGGALIVGLLGWRVYAPSQRKAMATNHFQRSEEFAHVGKWQEAVDEMRLAIRDDPKYFEARDGLAALYSSKEELYPEAAKVYEEGIALAPQDIRLHYELGHLYFDKHRYADAIRKMRDCLRLKPDDPHCLYMLGMSLERSEKWQEARKFWKEALALRPDDRVLQRGIQRAERRLRAGDAKPSVPVKNTNPLHEAKRP